MPRREISLNARWAVSWFEEGEGAALGAHLPDFDDSAWMEAIVPGDAHLDLRREATDRRWTQTDADEEGEHPASSIHPPALSIQPPALSIEHPASGIEHPASSIEDLFFGLNHLDCRWMEEKEWWYRREFFPPEEFEGQRLELSFQGLDTFATVWVNGRRAGTHRNMFVPCTFDVTGLIEVGHRNTVAVCFSSPLKAVEGKPTDGLSAAFGTRERLHARKAQMSYGWDIAPRLLTCGIWRPAYLVAKGDVSLGDVAARTSIEGRRGVTVDPEQGGSSGACTAVVRLEIPLEANAPGVRRVRIEAELRRPKSVITEEIDVEVSDGRATAHIDLTVPEPRLWWPWNIGRPELYQLTVRAFVGERMEDEYRAKIGIRSVELVQKPQADGGTSFVFAVNGQRIYAKGTNWIPGDAIFARMTRRKYRELIDLALGSNCNMLRVWGGGIYEDPYFYRTCDERGIMVWQDFMFSCADYPEDEEFLSEVRYEAEKVVAGLRNHPCVVLWCGDNEIDAGRGWQGRTDLENAINRGVLPEVCGRLDPSRPYITSSPCSPSGDPDAQSRLEGDYHNWHHGTSFRDAAYTQDTCRFISEIGHLSVPWPESVRRFIPESEVWPPENRAWEMHFGTLDGAETHRRERLDEAIAAFGFERPESIEGYAALTQLIQALAYKEWMEHYRRRKPLCGGSLYWNLYDNWPQFSDSAVDYYQNPKMAYYFVSRAFANCLVSLQELERGLLGVWLINDELRPRAGKLLLRCQRFDGGTAWTRTLPVRLQANSSRMVWQMQLPEPLMQDRSACFAQAQLLIGNRAASENFYFPADYPEIEWPETFLKARALGSSMNHLGTHVEISVASELYARLVRIETPGYVTRISDNFFDIPPGEARNVRVRLPLRHAGPLPVRISAANGIRAVEMEVGA